MLGHKLLHGLSLDYEVLGTVRGSLDTVHPKLKSSNFSIIPGMDAHDSVVIEKMLASEQPDVLINCIGLIKQKGGSTSDSEMVYLNSYFPHLLKELCRAKQIRLIHFSTDCVFSGKKGHYSETDLSDAEDLYGKTKFVGEIHDEHCVTIRSSIIGPEISTKHGLFQWFVDSNEITINGYTQAIYSGLTTLEMVNVIKLILKRPDIGGLWQVTSTPISKFSLLDLINKELGLNKTIIPYHDFQCDRSLDGTRFSTQAGYTPPEWEMAIKEMVDDYRKQKVLY